jgi:tryptophan-rich sensory protein
VFGPVWTALYTLMGIAAYLVWRSPRGRPRTTALAVFGIQLALNAAWTPVFFGLGSVGAAFAVILAVWAAVLAMMLTFAKVERRYGLLVAPLLAWVSFATVLNGAIFVLNR